MKLGMYQAERLTELLQHCGQNDGVRSTTTGDEDISARCQPADLPEVLFNLMFQGM